MLKFNKLFNFTVSDKILKYIYGQKQIIKHGAKFSLYIEKN